MTPRPKPDDTDSTSGRRRRLEEAFAGSLPEETRDDTDEAWGDRPARRDEEWFRRQVPPHHG